MQKYTQDDLNILQRYIQMSQAYHQLQAFPKQIQNLSLQLDRAPDWQKASFQEQLNATQEAYQKFQGTVQQTFPDIHPNDFPERMQQIEQQYFETTRDNYFALQRQQSYNRQPDTLPEKAFLVMRDERNTRVEEMYRQKETELKLQQQEEREQSRLEAQKDALWTEHRTQEAIAPAEQKIGEAKDRLIQTAPPDLLDEMAYETQKKISEINEKRQYCQPNERNALLGQIYEESTRLEKIHQRIEQLEQQQQKKDREEPDRSR